MMVGKDGLRVTRMLQLQLVADEVEVEDDDMTRQLMMPKDAGRELRVQMKVDRMTYA